ncbi:3'-5' exonuclease [Oceanibaculum pacificum]|uniref:PAS domain-containing protein n=1 Tax=Oceanibaculum pacificum TaxID=580166 RepID=A0A154VJ71_9PROT|nr:exonuclease domain-containing protein [Oceanibaculum pacificum]KZD01354.1 hypothetical protein AUP43_13900 [Oceanibaculum pacificum]
MTANGPGGGAGDGSGDRTPPRSRGGLRKNLFAGLVAATCGFLLAALPPLFGTVDLAAGLNGLALLSLSGLALGIAAIWILLTLIDGHFDQVERLQGAVLSAAARERGLGAGWSGGDGRSGDELHRLAAVLDDLLIRFQDRRSGADRRLAAILGAIDAAILVVTETGLVSLFNSRAAALLGADRLHLAGSIFAALEREDVIAAAHAARANGSGPHRAVLRGVRGESHAARIVPLTEPGGLLLAFEAAEGGQETGIHHDLALHDLPPEAPVTGDTPLDALSALVLDCETTGLDVASDRVVSLATVRMHGARIYHHVTLDRLVRPEIPIPARASVVHGITDAMVAGAPPIADILPEALAAMRGKVVIGHSIAFDMALLRREAQRSGIAWEEPATLCTALLYSALEPRAADGNLEAIAQSLGLVPEGRHTALGDCLLTAEIYASLLPRLQRQGVTTLDEARRFAARARPLLEMQRRAGWHEAEAP